MSVIKSIGVEFDLSEHTYKQIDLNEFDYHAIQHHEKVYWFHCDLNQQDSLKQLIDKLHLPNDVTKLCDKNDVISKLIDSGDGLTLRFQCVLSTALHGRHPVQFGSLVIHLTSRYCITFSYDEIPAVSSFVESYQKAVQYAKSPCFILFLLLDNIINDYSEILFSIELVAEKIELRLRNPRRNPYREAIYTKKQVMRIKRYAGAIRDMLMRISGRKVAVISEQCRLSLVNLFDHSLMIVGETDALRDILNSSLDQIDNALMYKMSQSMKVLTAFAAIFLPMTLIAGIYGMNFHWMPELSWRYGYLWALFLMLLILVVSIILFKRKNWF